MDAGDLERMVKSSSGDSGMECCTDKNLMINIIVNYLLQMENQ